MTLNVLPGEDAHRIHLESFLTVVTDALNMAMAVTVGGHILKTKLVTNLAKYLTMNLSWGKSSKSFSKNVIFWG